MIANVAVCAVNGNVSRVIAAFDLAMIALTLGTRRARRHSRRDQYGDDGKDDRHTHSDLLHWLPGNAREAA
jgi:hypothetical protein